MKNTYEKHQTEALEVTDEVKRFLSEEETLLNRVKSIKTKIISKLIS